MKKQLSQVLQFHKIFDSFVGEKATSDIPPAVKSSRVKLIREETEELIDAIEHGTIREIAKELGDVLYVVLGTALAFGLHSFLEKIFTDVHHGNLSKIDSQGNFKITENKDKILKGKTYKKPKLEYLPDER